MTPRARTGPPTRERLLEAAHRLMLEKGYPATTVDSICEAAEASKGSFYHSFKSKEELTLAVLEKFYREGAEEFMTPAIQREPDPVRKMDLFLEHVAGLAHGLWGEGCLLGNLANELVKVSPTVQQKLEELFGHAARQWAPLFEPAAAPGSSQADPDHPTATELAEHFLATIEGSIIMARAHQDPARLVAGIRHFKRYAMRLATAGEAAAAEPVSRE